MTPAEYYQYQCQNGALVRDDQQIAAISYLNEIYLSLCQEAKARQYYRFLRKPKAIQGAYLCGNVGIGKTLVMDCFYHCLPFAQKHRMHFHHFMVEVHQQLKRFQGKKIH